MFRKDINSTIPSKFHKKIGKINYSSQSSPSLKPKKIKPRRKVVFVNPDDDHYLYWWPALVVPEIEYNLFKQSYDDSNNFKIPNENEILVCYFEDGSFSVIPESDSVPFSPNIPPYTKYLADPNISQAFKNDKAVKLAKLYLETGEIPSTFLWLKDVPLEDKDEKINERNKVEDRKKKLLNSAYPQKRRDKKEKELIKKSPKLQNKPNPIVKLSNIKNTQSQEFKHTKLSDLKSQNKLYIYNNGMMKHMNKMNESNISNDKNDVTSPIHHGHGIIKNEMNRMNKSLNLSSSSLNNNSNNINSSVSTISSGSVNGGMNIKNDLSKQNNKYKSNDYENSSIPSQSITKSHNNGESVNFENKNYDSQDNENSTNNNSIKIRSRKVSINRERSRDTFTPQVEDTIELPEYLTKPLIFNIKKQKLIQQQDDTDILSLFPEPKKKRLKKTFDAVQNFVNQSIDNAKISNNNNNEIFPIPPIYISDV